MSSLSKQQCEPYGKDSKPLKTETAKILLRQLNNDWRLAESGKSIQRRFSFQNYYETIAFVNAIAWIAHQQDHHPLLEVAFNRCKVEFSTHSLGGLSVNDFICAAKIDLIKKPESSDPDLKSSEQPRQYATEAIKLSDIEPNLEPEPEPEPKTKPSADSIPPSSIAPQFDDDEPIFNHEGEIILEPIVEENKPALEENTNPSHLDTQTIVMSHEELKNLSKPIEPSEPAIEETAILDESNEDVGDTTIPDSNQPPAKFSVPFDPNPAPEKPPEPQEAQTVIMSLADMNPPEEPSETPEQETPAKEDEPTLDTQPEMEKTVIMAPPKIDASEPAKEDAEDTQKIDPAIEDDDTLVMHANTYERVKE